MPEQAKKMRTAYLICFSISNFHSRNNHQKDHNIFVSPNILHKALGTCKPHQFSPKVYCMFVKRKNI
jgi:hypothetical protein